MSRHFPESAHNSIPTMRKLYAMSTHTPPIVMLCIFALAMILMYLYDCGPFITYAF
jgi:hypothetical protein